MLVLGAAYLALAGDALGAKQQSPRLDGSFAVRLTVVEDSTQFQTPGDVNDRTFLFMPTCRKGACNVKVKLKSGSTFEVVALERAGSTYRGSKTVSFECVDRLIEIELRVAKSSKKDGPLHVTRVTGSLEFTDTPKADRPECSGAAFHQLSKVVGKLAAARPGARLEGTWQAGFEVTGGSFSELVDDTLGEKGMETWMFTPICPTGACDVLVVVADAQDFFFPIVLYLSYEGDNRYEALSGVSDALACTGGRVYPGYHGSVSYSLEVTGTGAIATAYEATATLHKEVTAEAIAAGCGPGTIESIRSYTGSRASG